MCICVFERERKWGERKGVGEVGGEREGGRVGGTERESSVYEALFLADSPVNSLACILNSSLIRTYNHPLSPKRHLPSHSFL